MTPAALFTTASTTASTQVPAEASVRAGQPRGRGDSERFSQLLNKAAPPARKADSPPPAPAEADSRSPATAPKARSGEATPASPPGRAERPASASARGTHPVAPDRDADPETKDVAAPAQAAAASTVTRMADDDADTHEEPTLDPAIAAGLGAFAPQLAAIPPADPAEPAAALPAMDTAPQGTAPTAIGQDSLTVDPSAVPDAPQDSPRASSAQPAAESTSSLQVGIAADASASNPMVASSAGPAVAALSGASSDSATSPAAAPAAQGASSATPITAHAMAAPQSAPQVTGAPGTAAPGRAEAHVHAAPGSDEFAPLLAAQVSYLVKKGVQQARLMLNPAEMGPVSVSITLQGQQAQVDFGAQHAATRQALEQSLAHLAASLQGAGFTLTGGGVSQHSQPQGRAHGQAQHDGAPGRHRTADAGSEGQALEATTAPMRPAHRNGRVDLYA